LRAEDAPLLPEPLDDDPSILGLGLIARLVLVLDDLLELGQHLDPDDEAAESARCL